MALTSFGLTPEYKVEILRTSMTVAHYSKGAFSVMDLYNMPVHLRGFFIREFSKLKEEEATQLERARNKK